MRIRFSLFTGALLAAVGSVGAGSMELAPKETAPPTITQSEPWQFTIAAPGWMAGMNGTIGVRGVNAVHQEGKARVRAPAKRALP